MTALAFHPIAGIFPLVEGAEFDGIVADVRAHGVREPIWLYEGMILDGRNRYRAAQKAGVSFATRTFDGSPLDAINHVWSLNRTRRHLSSSQAAVAAAKRNKLTDAYAPVREAAKARRLSTLKQNAPVPEQIPERDGPSLSQQAMAAVRPRSDGETRQIRAKAAGTNPKYIDIADRLVSERPELAAEVEAGRKTLTQVQRDLRREELAAKTPPAPTGKYRIIYADPPWKYNDALAISRDGLGESYGPADAHYPPMSIAELCDLPVEALAEDDAVLFLWATSPLLEEAFKIIRAWGFKYKASFVWDKIKHNMGHYNSVRHEFLLIATRGSCTPDVKRLFDSVQSIERTDRHSEKPGEFRAIIDALYTRGARIELFARGAAEGWSRWGNEADAA